MIEKKKTPTDYHQYWQKEFDAAEKRADKYLIWGNAIVARYIDERLVQLHLYRWLSRGNGYPTEPVLGQYLNPTENALRPNTQNHRGTRTQ